MQITSRYRVLETLGQGAGGAVHVVEDLLSPGRPIALKVLAGDDRAVVEALEREFELLATLRHPRLAEVFDFGRVPVGEPGGPATFMTRELLEGEPLGVAAREADLVEIVSLGIGLCRALAPLHAAGLVHGDLKPDNVVVAFDGFVRLIDFGLAHTEGDTARLPAGTLPYLAPEVLQGRSADARSDLYALGVLLFELVTGAPPFTGAASAVVSGHLEQPVPELEPVREHLRAASLGAFDRVAAVVMRLLAKEPEARFAGVGEVEAALSLALPAAVPSGDDPPAALPAWVGREGTMARLDEALRARLVAGDPAAEPIVAVRGGPGTGKSTVLKEARWRAQLAGVQVVEMACPASPSPPGPIAELARRLESLTGREGGEGAVEERVAAAALAAARARPLVVVVEDLHLSVPETGRALRFLGHAAGPEEPLLVLVSYDSGPSGAVDALGEHDVVDLPALSRSEIARLASRMLGRHDEELARKVHEWTEGNPLFCIEVLQKVREAGGVAASGLEALGVPRRLEEFWAAAARGVGPGERRMLAAAALLGHRASVEGLAAVAGLAAPGAAAAVAELSRIGLFRRESGGPDVLAHAGLASVALAALEEGDLAEMHGRAAALLRESGAPASEQAHHLLRAGSAERREGRALALEAARVLHGSGASRLAAELLGEALDGWHDAPVAASLLMSEALHGAGEYDRAAERLQPALASTNGDERAAGLALLGRVQSARGDYDGASAAWREALVLLADVDARVRLRRDFGRMLLRRGELDAARSVTREALGEVRPSDPVRAELLCTEGMAADYAGDPDGAFACYEEALGIARASGGRREEGSALAHIAIARQRRSDYAGAREAYQGALAIARELGDVGTMSVLHGNLGGLAHLEGELVSALEYYQVGLRLARRAGRESTALAARANLGLLHLHLGEHAKARREIDAALAAATRLGASHMVAQATAQLAELAFREGRLEDAVSAYEDSLERYDSMGRRREAAEVALDLAAALVERGGPEDLRSAGERIDGVRRGGTLAGDKVLEGKALLVEGRLLAGRGEEDRALALLTRAATRAREEHNVEMEWEAEAAGAELLLRRGAPLAARAKLQRTVEILEQLAAALPPELRRSYWQDRMRAAARAALERAEADWSGAEGPGGGSPGEAEMLYRLLDINKRINSDPDLPRLFERIMDSAVELTGAERGFLLLTDDEGHLGITTARDFDQATPDDAHLQFSRSIAETVLIDGEPVITVNAMDDNRFCEYLSVHKLRLQSVLCIPIRSRARVIGVLYMENRLRRGGFGEPDQRLLLAFADQVAIALENARLMGELTRRQGELERAKEEIERLCEERGQLLNRRTAQLEEARRDLRQAMDQIRSRVGFEGIIGQSEPMLRVFAILDRVRQTDVPVVISGSSGTGKEMVARAIHRSGPRAKKAFVAINCGAIPETLLESELFGYVRGSFTGADRDKKGLLLAAQGGTVLLDEIGDMPLKMQLDLLRVLQEKKVRPLGSERDVEIDVRILAASNRPLRELIGRGTFREDLYYRLSVVEIALPPLRERTEDVPLLVDHFLGQIAARFDAPKKSVSGDAMRALMAFSWPGNVRQLEHALMNAWVMSDGATIGAGDLTLEPMTVSSFVEPSDGLPPATEQDRRRLEKQRILEALQKTGWNKSSAAKVLGMPRRTLYRRLRFHGIQ